MIMRQTLLTKGKYLIYLWRRRNHIYFLWLKEYEISIDLDISDNELNSIEELQLSDSIEELQLSD